MRNEITRTLDWRYIDSETAIKYIQSLRFDPARENHLYYVTSTVRNADAEDRLNAYGTELIDESDPNYKEKTYLPGSIKRHAGNYIMRVRPSVEKIVESNSGYMQSEFVRKVESLLDPDRIREQALDAGGDVREQYVFYRLAMIGQRETNTRPYIGSCNITENSLLMRAYQDIDKRVRQSYAHSEVERIGRAIHNKPNANIIIENYKKMEKIVEEESRRYRIKAEEDKKRAEKDEQAREEAKIEFERNKKKTEIALRKLGPSRDLIDIIFDETERLWRENGNTLHGIIRQAKEQHKYRHILRELEKQSKNDSPRRMAPNMDDDSDER